jgi:hypothetical protein
MIMLIVTRNKRKNKVNAEVFLIETAIVQPFYSHAVGL